MNFTQFIQTNSWTQKALSEKDIEYLIDWTASDKKQFDSFCQSIESKKKKVLEIDGYVYGVQKLNTRFKNTVIFRFKSSCLPSKKSE